MISISMAAAREGSTIVLSANTSDTTMMDCYGSHLLSSPNIFTGDQERSLGSSDHGGTDASKRLRQNKSVAPKMSKNVGYDELNAKYTEAMERLSQFEQLTQLLREEISSKDSIIINLEDKIIQLSFELATAKAGEDEHRLQQRMSSKCPRCCNMSNDVHESKTSESSDGTSETPSRLSSIYNVVAENLHSALAPNDNTGDKKIENSPESEGVTSKFNTFFREKEKPSFSSLSSARDVIRDTILVRHTEDETKSDIGENGQGKNLGRFLRNLSVGSGIGACPSRSKWLASMEDELISGAKKVPTKEGSKLDARPKVLTQEEGTRQKSDSEVCLQKEAAPKRDLGRNKTMKSSRSFLDGVLFPVNSSDVLNSLLEEEKTTKNTKGEKRESWNDDLKRPSSARKMSDWNESAGANEDWPEF